MQCEMATIVPSSYSLLLAVTPVVLSAVIASVQRHDAVLARRVRVANEPTTYVRHVAAPALCRRYIKRKSPQP